jgi:hypothetical protein
VHNFRSFQSVSLKGEAHVSLLCARVYETKLQDRETAAKVAKALLQMSPEGDDEGFGLEPLAIVEARRLLARCYAGEDSSDQATIKDSSNMALDQLRKAIDESRQLGFKWLQQKALSQMLEIMLRNRVPNDTETINVTRTELRTVTQSMVVGNEHTVGKLAWVRNVMWAVALIRSNLSLQVLTHPFVHLAPSPLNPHPINPRSPHCTPHRALVQRPLPSNAHARYQQPLCPQWIA